MGERVAVPPNRDIVPRKRDIEFPAPVENEGAWLSQPVKGELSGPSRARRSRLDLSLRPRSES